MQLKNHRTVAGWVYLKASMLPVKAPVESGMSSAFRASCVFVALVIKLQELETIWISKLSKGQYQSSSSSFIAGIGLSQVAETEDLCLCYKQIHPG